MLPWFRIIPGLLHVFPLFSHSAHINSKISVLSLFLPSKFLVMLFSSSALTLDLEPYPHLPKAFRTSLSVQNSFSCCFPEPRPRMQQPVRWAQHRRHLLGNWGTSGGCFQEFSYCQHKNQVLTHVNNSIRATNKQPRCFTVTLHFFFS